MNRDIKHDIATLKLHDEDLRKKYWDLEHRFHKLLDQLNLKIEDIPRHYEVKPRQ